MHSDSYYREPAGKCVCVFFQTPGVFPLISGVISDGEYLSSDYSIKIWDSSHALELRGTDETAVITDQVNTIEMWNFASSIFSNSLSWFVRVMTDFGCFLIFSSVINIMA